MDQQTRRKRVVVVEDEFALCVLLQTHFSKYYHITIFPDAESCLEAVSTLENVDVVIIDYRLPQMNGVELFKALRPLVPHAKFILTTGYLSPDSAEQEFKVGFDAMLLKPFDLQTLEKTISGLLPQN